MTDNAKLQCPEHQGEKFTKLNYDSGMCIDSGCRILNEDITIWTEQELLDYFGPSGPPKQFCELVQGASGSWYLIALPEPEQEASNNNPG